MMPQFHLTATDGELSPEILLVSRQKKKRNP
jgi:hypothetical protein